MFQGVCTAIRVEEAIPTLNCTPQADGVVFSSSQLRISGMGKKSKWCFLKASCTDDTIRRSRKGAGGNTGLF